MSKTDDKELDEYENESDAESSEVEIVENEDNINSDNEDLNYNIGIDDVNTEKRVLENQKKFVNKDERITRPILYNYEFVRMVGLREYQLTLGAKPLIKHNNLSYKEISYEEIKHNVIPLILIRTLPNGNIEKWNIEELSKKYLKYNL